MDNIRVVLESKSLNNIELRGNQLIDRKNNDERKKHVYFSIKNLYRELSKSK
jgi:hypothetical protein